MTSQGLVSRKPAYSLGCWTDLPRFFKMYYFISNAYVISNYTIKQAIKCIANWFWPFSVTDAIVIATYESRFYFVLRSRWLCRAEIIGPLNSIIDDFILSSLLSPPFSAEIEIVKFRLRLDPSSAGNLWSKIVFCNFIKFTLLTTIKIFHSNSKSDEPKNALYPPPLLFLRPKSNFHNENCLLKSYSTYAASSIKGLASPYISSVDLPQC